MIWTFDGFELDDQQRELRREGRRVALEPKSLDALLTLVRHSKRIVSQDELIERVWEGAAISQTVVPKTISVLRRKLREAGASRDCVESLRGRGYRFVAALSSRAGETEEPAPVGRSEVCDQLDDQMAAVEAGSDRSVLIFGEPGIGKTRVVRELARRAGRRGAEVAWSACWPADRAPALWPFRTLVRETWGEDATPADLAVLGEAEPGASLPPRTQLRFFESLVDAIQIDPPLQGRLWIIEDLHLADAATRELFRFLAHNERRARLCLVATWRTGDPDPDALAETLDAITQPGGRIELGGLSSEATGSLLADILGRTPTPEQVDRAQALTRGNPLYLQYGAELLQQPVATPPGSLLSTLRAHMRALPDPVLRVLRVAALMGAEFEPEVVAHAESPDHPEAAARAIEEARMAGWIESQLGTGALRFRHALVAEALVEEIPKPDRPAVHAKVTAALEQLGLDSIPRWGPTIAYHATAAAPVIGPDRGIAASRASARAAIRRRAHREAALALARAAQTIEADASRSKEHCRLLLEQGEAEFREDLHEEARRTYGRAAARARELEDWGLFARAAMGFAGRNDAGLVHPDLNHDLLAEALDRLPADALAFRSRLTSLLAECDPHGAPLARRAGLAARALELARASGDTVAIVWALIARSATAQLPEADEWAGWADELVDIGSRPGARTLPDMMVDPLLAGYHHRLQTAETLGDFNGANDALASMSRLADDHGGGLYRWFASYARCGQAISRGEFEHIDAWIAGSQQLAAQTGRAYAPLGCLGHLFWMALQRGQVKELDRGLELVAEHPWAVGSYGSVVVAWVDGINGRAREAQLGLAKIASRGFDSLPEDASFFLLGHSMLAELCSAVGTAEQASICYERLAPYADLVVRMDDFMISNGSVHGALGALAVRIGDFARAEEHLREGLERNLGLDAAPAATSVACDLALLLHRRRPGHSDVRGLLDRAETLTRRMGPGIHADRVARTRRTVAGSGAR